MFVLNFLCNVRELETLKKKKKTKVPIFNVHLQHDVFQKLTNTHQHVKISKNTRLHIVLYAKSSNLFKGIGSRYCLPHKYWSKDELFTFKIFIIHQTLDTHIYKQKQNHRFIEFIMWYKFIFLVMIFDYASCI